MTYSDEIIGRIAELASSLTKPSDIAAILGLDAEALKMELSIKGSPVRDAYAKAKAETALMLRRQEIEFAKVGSPVAVQLTAAYLGEMDADEDL